MTEITVGIGGLAVSADSAAVLVTHGLGSCIAVLAHDPIRGAAGMLHFQLPTSSLSPGRARAEPGIFADTGIPLLLEKLRALGCRKGNLVVKAVGGASFNDPGTVFDIGRRNRRAMRRILREAGVPLAAEDVGGARPRTARLWVASGRVTVQSGLETSAL